MVPDPSMSDPMSKPPRRQPPLPPKPRENPDPKDAALRRCSDLIARGFDAGRLEREAASIIGDWRGSLEEAELRECLDAVYDQLAEGVDAANDMGCEIEKDDAASAKVHARSIGALAAARDAFGRAARAL
jgi:hypothetical protein